MILHRTLALVSVLALALGAILAPASAQGGADGRVVVLGFDGADWRTTEAMMDAGELPNLAKLREQGSAGPLVSTDPAESAAGWAAINTGANPVRNGVPSFIDRKIEGTLVMPGFAHVGTNAPYEATEEDLTGASGGLAGMLAGVDPIVLSLAVLAVGFVVFRFLLRANAALAFVIAALLGGGAYALGSTAGPAAPSTIPTYVSNEVRLDGFWVEAARAGHPSIALQAPMAFDRPGAEGARTLYGLGIPDIRGSVNGDWTLYSTKTLATGRAPKGESIGSTGTRFRVDFEAPDGGGAERIEAFVYGPIDFGEAGLSRARWEEIAAMQADESVWGALGFKESSELSREKKELEKSLAEMGMPVAGQAGSGREYKHRVKAPLTVVKSGDAYDVTIGSETKTLGVGDWSDFYTVRFTLGGGFELSAITRAKVLGDDPFELYVDTLQYDPRDQAFWQNTSSPPSFGAEMAKRLGAPYETLGWGCMTNQLKDRGVEPGPFLEDVQFTMEWRAKLMREALSDGDWEVLYSVFSTTDRVQHMMYRFYDPEHPMHDAEMAEETHPFFGEEVALKDTIPAIYRQMDAVVGEVMAALGPDDTLLLCADHGFTSYRRGMNVNNWLAEEGYLVLKDDLGSTGAGSVLGAIDWSRTRAYGLGLGMVYLNLEGREPEGIVARADADALMDEICERFLAARDEGRVVGTRAVKVLELYQGDEEWGTAAYPCSDVMLGFAEYYRTSWTTVDGSMDLARGEDGGIVNGAVYEDNDSLWSGDHASNDPNLVSGIFFSNRPMPAPEGGYSVFHIAPTVLSLVGAPLPDHLELAPLEASE